jgi:F-type H+-transporting ATPase subunit gamma
MPSLKEVRNRIKSVKSTQQITKAMKMVAASKLRRAQDNILQLRPFTQKLNNILENVIQASEEDIQTVYTQQRDLNKLLIVAVASDRGLCGAFNSNVFKKVQGLVNDQYYDIHKQGNLDILPVGKKSYDFFRKRDFQIIDQYWNLYAEISYEKVKEIAEFTMQSFRNQHYDAVIVVHNEFKNVATQILRAFPILPFEWNINTEDKKSNRDYIYEPSQKIIIQELIPQLLHIQFYQAILESIASEHGARMTAMEQASDNADELLGELQIAYNRTRQAVITKELNEIVGGAQALSQD